jgi:predicted Zn-dependent peptidase
LRFQASYLRPNNTILAVAGDFSAGDMRKRIEAVLGNWEPRSISRLEAESTQKVTGQHVLVVDKPDASQTYFRIGNLGVSKGHPDTAVLDVVNTVFGGRFTSWLTNEMRTKSGLTYSAYSRFIERSVPGPFFISSFTVTDSTERTIDLALDLLERLHERGLAQEELDSAKNYIRGQYPLDYETAGELASTMAELEFYGLDRSYVNDHARRTDAVTLDQAREAIRRHYPGDDRVIVMIGVADEIASVATKYGVVRQKKIKDTGY